MACGGKNIIKTTRAPTKKGEEERKDNGKEKKSDKKTEQELIKLWKTWEKCRQYHSFSPIILIVALKRA
jgi:hypothetical protein